METKEQNLIKEIKQLKEKRNAVILVHNYQRPEIYEIADFIGDSLELSRKAAETDKDIIVFCGVRFMAETAKILNPGKTVILAAEDAGCPMAEMINAKQLKELKKKHPKAAVVCYVNTNAETKAECDICCTSANVVDIVNSLKEGEAIMAPDKNLAAYTQTKTKKSLIPWNGYCPIHQEIKEKSAVLAKKQNPGAIFIAHPECPQEVLRHADYIFSTGKMLDFAKENTNKTIILATETDMINRLEKENPKNKYLSIGGLCPDMKKTTLEKVKEALEKNQYEIKVPEDTRKKAESSLRKMIAIGGKHGK
ncbi:quinolinate synthase [Candidatus Pacearchaeota archaeon RBG_13_36_9]|nr:MAG: quinolinate synthase [Candidatus Pacearchaeota archaeon RBG_13_36_9]